MSDDAKANAGLAARVLLGLILMASGFPKAVAPWQEFAAVMEAYYIPVSPDLIWTLAKILPWALLIFGLFLAAGYLTRTSAAAALAMVCVFFIALLSTIIRHVPLDHCGCFGAVNFTPPQAMGFDAISMVLAVCAYRFGRRRMSLDNWIDAGI